ncbi:hypothetical protein VNI00_015565 [Paramarasmius palmivorus]|uniref:Uncharacterized protein n=1 Tax=Paramarasmius palmivorus TaxID=297713 RepID=A0AAW0BKX0_9AGAR
MIFAATVIKFIDTDDEPPQDRLETVRQIFVEAGSDSPYSALDTLYHQILSMRSIKWEKVQPILRLLVTPHEYLASLRDEDDTDTPWRSPANIARLLGVQEAQILVTLHKLHSVLRFRSDNDDNYDDVDDDNDNDSYNYDDDDGYNVYIAHATFTEFLGDRCRSAKFYTPKMTQSEYCELLAMFSLRTLSDLAHNYPPYHIGSFTEAMSSWEKEFRTMDGQVRTLVLWGWTYWKDVTSPLSLDLVEALCSLDIYHFIGIWYRDNFDLERLQADLKRDIHLEEQIKLAKSRESMPRQFIERLELLQGIEALTLAFLPDTRGNSVFWWIRLAEQCCWRPPARVPSLDMVGAFLPRDSRPQGFLVLPPDSSRYGMSVPGHWITASITKGNFELESKLYDAANWRSNDEKKRILLEDIRNNTSYSVSKGIVEPSQGASENGSGAASKAP